MILLHFTKCPNNLFKNFNFFCTFGSTNLVAGWLEFFFHFFVLFSNQTIDIYLIEPSFILNNFSFICKTKGTIICMFLAVSLSLCNLLFLHCNSISSIKSKFYDSINLVTPQNVKTKINEQKTRFKNSTI